MREVFGAAVAALCLSGCATVMNGPNVDYAVKSDPEGATVRFSNGAECVSPCDLELKRRNHLRADITREGYKPAYVLIQSKGGGATVGNVLAGGIIGVMVDSGNGSNNFLTPRPLNVKLARADSADAAMLLDEKGKVIGTLDAHNDQVREKVVETLGRALAGYVDTSAPPSQSGTASPVLTTVTTPAEADSTASPTSPPASESAAPAEAPTGAGATAPGAEDPAAPLPEGGSPAVVGDSPLP